MDLVSLHRIPMKLSLHTIYGNSPGRARDPLTILLSKAVTQPKIAHAPSAKSQLPLCTILRLLQTLCDCCLLIGKVMFLNIKLGCSDQKVGLPQQHAVFINTPLV